MVTLPKAVDEDATRVVVRASAAVRTTKFELAVEMPATNVESALASSFNEALDAVLRDATLVLADTCVVDMSNVRANTQPTHNKHAEEAHVHWAKHKLA